MVKNSTRSDGWASLFASHSMNRLQAPNSEAWISQKSMFSPPWGSVVLWGIPLMALHIRNSQRNICGGRRKKRKNLSVLSTVWFGLCLASSINPLLTIAHLFFSFESPETEIPVCRARFWGEYIVDWVCSLMGRVRKRNAFFFFFSWHLCRSTAFAKELLQGVENGGLKKLCWLPSETYPVQLNQRVIYIGSCLNYGAAASA